jgi:hypothetical protein
MSTTAERLVAGPEFGDVAAHFHRGGRRREKHLLMTVGFDEARNIRRWTTQWSRDFRAA